MDLQHTYSFTAAFEDGTLIEHNHNDSYESKNFKGGTIFTDVQEKEKESKLISFVVHNDNLAFGVDLQDGHFEVNGIPFWQHRPDLDGYKDFRVIYYNTTQRLMSQNDEGVMEETNAGIIGYTVGWQTNDKEGNNVKKTLTFQA